MGTDTVADVPLRESVRDLLVSGGIKSWRSFSDDHCELSLNGMESRAMMMQGMIRWPHRTERCGFSLVELLIVIAILAILAGIVFPKYKNMSQEARAKTLASNVHLVHEIIQVHSNTGDYPLSPAGVPMQIYAAWFKGGAIPEHAWTGSPMRITVVSAGTAVVYPAVKTFDTSNTMASNAWYNTDNGSFCALVVITADPVETLGLFNIANSCDATDLGQTTR